MAVTYAPLPWVLSPNFIKETGEYGLVEKKQDEVSPLPRGLAEERGIFSSRILNLNHLGKQRRLHKTGRNINNSRTRFSVETTVHGRWAAQWVSVLFLMTSRTRFPRKGITSSYPQKYTSVICGPLGTQTQIWKKNEGSVDWETKIKFKVKFRKTVTILAQTKMSVGSPSLVIL